MNPELVVVGRNSLDGGVSIRTRVPDETLHDGGTIALVALDPPLEATVCRQLKRRRRAQARDCHGSPAPRFGCVDCAMQHKCSGCIVLQQSVRCNHHYFSAACRLCREMHSDNRLLLNTVAWPPRLIESKYAVSGQRSAAPL